MDKRPIRWRLIAPLALVGAALMLFAVLPLAPTLVSLFQADVHDVPGTFTVELEANERYAVAVQTASQQGAGVTIGRTWSVDVQSLDVVGPDGAPLPIEPPGISESFARSGVTFSSVAHIVPTTAGPHTFDLETDREVTAIVTRSIDFGPAFIYRAVASVVGSLLLLVAAVLLLLDFLRRRDKVSNPPPSPPPPSPPAVDLPPPPSSSPDGLPSALPTTWSD